MGDVRTTSRSKRFSTLSLSTRKLRSDAGKSGGTSILKLERKNRRKSMKALKIDVEKAHEEQAKLARKKSASGSLSDSKRYAINTTVGASKSTRSPRHSSSKKSPRKSPRHSSSKKSKPKKSKHASKGLDKLQCRERKCTVRKAGQKKSATLRRPPRSRCAKRRSANELQFMNKLEKIETIKVQHPKAKKAEQKKVEVEVEDGEHATKRERVATMITHAMEDVKKGELSAFEGSGKKSGLVIWRINKMIPEKLPSNKHGKFYSGDSYICLMSTFKGRSRMLDHNLFYWIGRKAPQDSVTSACIRSVQLNEMLEGGVTHHRETQGHESKEFLSLFGRKIKYLKGGSESALNHVTEEVYETRLLHLIVNGNDSTARMVEPVCASLNEEDTFVLDDGNKIWVWIGEKAGISKKGKAIEVANFIKAENGGKGKVKLLTGAKRDKPAEFWNLLGGKHLDQIAATHNAAAEEEYRESLFLYLITKDENDEFDADPVEELPLVRSLLKTENTYVLDCGTEMFAWIGKESSWESRDSALLMAEDFLTMFNRPLWTPMIRISEGHEPVLFKSKFVGWVEEHPVIEEPPSRVAPAPEQKRIDYSNLLTFPEPSEDLFKPTNEDEDSSALEVWSLNERGDAESVEEEVFGNFHTDRSFIALYSYSSNDEVKSVAYFWGGARSPNRDYMAYQSSFYSVLEQQMADDGGKPPKKERIYEGGEGKFFLSLFSPFVVQISDSNPNQLYIIRGKKGFTKVFQQKCEAQWLNSAFTAVLVTPQRAFIWKGSGTRKRYARIAKSVVKRFCPDGSSVSLREGAETEEFWSALGETAPSKNYSNANFLQNGYPSGYPRAFVFSQAIGVVEVEEAVSFTQHILCEKEVLLLDMFHHLFLWQGSTAPPSLVKYVTDDISNYVTAACTGNEKRPEKLLVEKIESGSEPVSFKGAFPRWERAEDVISKQVEADREKKLRYIENERKKPQSPLLAELFGKVNEKLQLQEQNSSNGAAVVDGESSLRDKMKKKLQSKAKKAVKTT
eukprot:TRINITY_DN6118_c0_g1_i1.p1 TRINITY_DN6118_c0_g1~~TRINITY_DN6118_c0_g1_i1.p1  ORF type:complete len:1019 (-),score=200.11 TRINITY_DN6118_c0_g1_i1:125-3181(-)